MSSVFPLSDPPRTMLEHALAYVEQHGLALCLIRPGSKIPMLAEWNSPHRVVSSAESAQAVFGSAIPGSGMGLVHEQARTAAIDVDDEPATRLIFAEYGWDYDAMFAAFPRIRSRAGRDKIIFRLPDGFEPGVGGLQSKLKLNWPNQWGECDENGKIKLITVFELRGGQNQDVLPPSIHPDTGAPYSWADGQAPWDYRGGIPSIPADHPFLVIWYQWDRFKRQLEELCPWRADEDRTPPPQARIYAPGPNSNIIGQFNRVFAATDILERNGYVKRGKRWLAPHSSTKIPGVVALKGGKVYSHHGSDILNNGHAHDAFSVFTILEHGDSINLAVRAAALELGIGPQDTLPGCDFTALIQNSLNKQKRPDTRTEPKTPYAFPRHLLDVPGLVGMTADYIASTSLFPQPILALAASLAWCGSIMGRKVRTPSDLRTNIYAIGIADSGSGKEHARKAIKRLAVEAGMSAYIGAEKLASDQGLFAMLSVQPSCLALLDEFGRTIRIIGSEKAPAHLQQLATMLMELTGSADSFIIEKRRAEHGGDNLPRIVTAPNLAIYATTVPGRLYQGLTMDEITDGFLPRWLAFESDEPDPEMIDGACLSSPDGMLTSACARWDDEPIDIDDLQKKNILPNARVNPRTIPIDPDAEALFKDSAALWRGKKKDARGSGMDSLWARAYEHALRCALIAGAGHQDAINLAEAAWACELVDHLISRMAQQAGSLISSNAYESDVQRVEAFVRDRGSVSRTELARKFRSLKQQERTAIIAALQEAELITIEQTKTEGRSEVRVVWVGE